MSASEAVGVGSLREWVGTSTPDARLFHVESIYTERVWLPIIGPTPTLALRLMVELIEAAPDRIAAVALDELSAGLGLGVGIGPNSSFERALRRLERHRLVRRDESQVFVKTHVPALGDRDVARLTPYVQSVHRRLLDLEG